MLLPLAAASWLPRWRGKVHPSPYIRRPLGGGDNTPVFREPIFLAASYHLPSRRPPLAIVLYPLLLLCGLPKGCVGEGNHHRCMPSWCRVFGSLSKAVYFHISAGTGIPRIIVVAVRVRVRGGATRVTPESLLQVLHRPWGRLRRLHRQRLCGSVIPVF
jgi:hypothetical protein